MCIRDRLSAPGTYERLEATSGRMACGLAEIAEEVGVELTTVAAGGIFGFFFHPGPVRSFTEAAKSNEERFRRFYSSMLDQGIYLAPSPYECGFASLAHRPADIDAALEAARVAMRKASRVG